MFANLNANYIASIRLTYKHPDWEKIYPELQRFLVNHWDFRVSVLRSSGSAYGCVLELEVERGYTNQRDFASYIGTRFIDSLKDYINYVVVTFLKTSPIVWPAQYHFTVNNAEKLMGYTDLQINDGGRYFYMPESPSHVNAGTYLDTGDYPK
jgi:hypothetical protein